MAPRTGTSFAGRGLSVSPWGTARSTRAGFTAVAVVGQHESLMLCNATVVRLDIEGSRDGTDAGARTAETPAKPSRNTVLKG